jgi:hypothetical protein
MKFAKKTSLFLAAVLFAGLLTAPASAQQEVSPDHFDDNPAVARAKKPAAAKTQAASARSHRTATAVSAQAKPKGVSHTAVKVDGGKEIASNSR